MQYARTGKHPKNFLSIENFRKKCRNPGAKFCDQIVLMMTIKRSFAKLRGTEGFPSKASGSLWRLSTGDHCLEPRGVIST